MVKRNIIKGWAINQQVLSLFYRGRNRPQGISLEENEAVNGHVPPLRVGDFIRTFPFNKTTLKASQQELDVKVIVQELHKLTRQLAKPEKKRKREEDKDGGEDFDSLLWGPKDPPLISQCLRNNK